MLSTIYGELKEILNDQQIEELKEFLDFQYNSYISCNNVANHLNISYDKAKKLSIILLKNDILDMNFKVYCDNEIDICNQTVYENIQDIPEWICDNCEKGCSILKNIIVIYKVIDRYI